MIGGLHINKGVRQGCILSPPIFNIFLADLAAKLDFPGYYESLIAGGEKLSCILWTDDLVLLSEDEGLNNMLSKFSINKEKTKCIIFNKTGRFI